MKSNRGMCVTLLAGRTSLAIALLCVDAAHGQRRTPAKSGGSGAGGGESLKDSTVKETVKVLGIRVGERASPCYKGVGCFRLADNMRLRIGGPQSPVEVGTRFFFFAKEVPRGREVNRKTWNQIAKKKFVNFSKLLVAIIHGYTSSSQDFWAVAMKEAVLKHVHCNVVMVDWKKGAAGPIYHSAARNTPMPGVQLSRLLQKITRSSESQLTARKVHVIGFSLGAQVAGFCGRHFRKATGKKVGRITGLDPAGPLFDDSDACLSKTDAKFVDIIHTNAGKLVPAPARYELNASVGHVDFYPNGGHDQPGCGLSISGCSHQRAPEFFTQSLTNRRCKFKSYYCAGGWKEYVSGSCKRRSRSFQRGEMGYYSINRPGRKNQYLKTRNSSPYCIRQ